MKNTVKHLSAVIIFAYIAYFAAIIYTGGCWEYGSCVIAEKAHQLSAGGPLYPHIIGLDRPVYTWPYTPLSAIIYEYYYLLFHGNEKLLSLASLIMFVATGLVAGIIASRISDRNVVLPTLAMFLAPVFITEMGSAPRVDTVALFFLSLALLEYERGNDRIAILYFLLAFLSKQSYIFTLPFFYLLRKDFKNLFSTLLLIAASVIVLSLVSRGFYENVIVYTVSQAGENLSKFGYYFNMTLAMYFVTGMFVMFYLSLNSDRHEYVYLSLLFLPLVSYMMIKPGSSVNYYYQPLLILAIAAGAGFAKSKRKTLTMAIILLFFALQMSTHPVLERVNALKAIDSIVDGSVLSDDACIDSGHYDWFLLNQYARIGLWSWDAVSSSIAKHEYDYIVLYNTTYSGCVTHRIDARIYSLIEKEYGTYTIIYETNTPVVILTPRGHDRNTYKSSTSKSSR